MDEFARQMLISIADSLAVPGRDRLAAMVVQGWLASFVGQDINPGTEPRIAEFAYRMADAMIAQRTK